MERGRLPAAASPSSTTRPPPTSRSGGANGSPTRTASASASRSAFRRASSGSRRRASRSPTTTARDACSRRARSAASCATRSVTRSASITPTTPTSVMYRESATSDDLAVRSRDASTALSRAAGLTALTGARALRIVRGTVLALRRCATQRRREDRVGTKRTTKRGERDGYDVAIVGGGPAGLSASIWLARYLHRVVLVDSGDPRNWETRGINGFLGHPGHPSRRAARRGPRRGAQARRRARRCRLRARRLSRRGITSSSRSTTAT